MPDDNTTSRVIDDLRRTAAGLPAGSRLPSVRQLMARHRAGPATVQRAVSRLAGEGLLDPRPGRGTFVTARADRASETAPDLGWQSVALGGRRAPDAALGDLLAAARPGQIGLSSGFPDPSLLPTGPLGAALGRAGRRPAAWARVPTEGVAELRAWFAREAGGRVGPHDVLVCAGGQSALGTIFRALASPGDAVIVESPTYVGALAAIRLAGLRPVPVPIDGDGVRPDLLAAAFASSGARLAVLQPTFHNPAGTVLAAVRRAAVLDAAAAAGAFLVEDDYARDLAIDGEAPAPLVRDDRDGHVVYVRSLTKSAAPSLRVAGVAARGPAGARLRATRAIDDFFVSGPLQEAALDFVSSPAWRRHRRVVTAALRERRAAAVAAMARHVPEARLTSVPRGGFHLWYALPVGVDDVALAADAAAAGVIVSPGSPWFPAEPPAPHLRVTYAAASVAEIEEGVARLASVWPAA